MKLVGRYVLLTLFLMGCFALGAVAQQQGGVSSTLTADYHHITGFRSAQFGMAKSDVRAAIKSDFGVDDAAIEEMLNLDQGTTIIGVNVPSLAPGPGPASVFYIFGATSEQLMYVNVIWATSDEPTPADRDRVVVAGLQLAHYFEDLKWQPEATVGGVSLNPGEVLTFAGVDPEGAGVQVIVSGVPMTDEEGHDMPASGPAMLQVSYTARFGEPDVVTVEPGAF